MEYLSDFWADLTFMMSLHLYQWSALMALVGACIASFVGVVAVRLPHSAGWRTHPDVTVNLSQPSHCDHCGVRLPVLALIPIFGWLLSRGRCGSCGAKVPAIYPTVELATAVASGLVAFTFGPTEKAVWALVLLWSCLAVSWIDWLEGWIPSRIVAPMIIAGMVASPFEHDVLSRNIGVALCVGGIAMSGAIVSYMRGGQLSVGGGDLELAAVAGAWLGQYSAPLFLLVTSILQLVTHGLVRLLPNGKWVPSDPDLQEEIEDGVYAPMGPALCIAFFVCLVLSSFNLNPFAASN